MKVSGNASKKLKQFERKIDRAKKKTLKEFGEEQKRDARHRIAVSKVDPRGDRWSPWSFSTLRARTRRGTVGKGLLYESGRLWRSIYYRVRGNKVEVGSSADYAKYLQEGSGKMPRRQILNLNTKKAKAQFKKMFKRNLRK